MDVHAVLVNPQPSSDISWLRSLRQIITEVFYHCVSHRSCRLNSLPCESIPERSPK